MSCSIQVYVKGEPMDIWDVVDEYTGSLKNAKKIDVED